MAVHPNTYLKSNSPLLREIQRWVAESVTYEYDHWKREQTNSLLLGMLVYGKYVERFLRFTIPSLLASGNLSALSARPLIAIHTDEQGMATLQEGLKCLHPVADVELYPIGPNLEKLTRIHHDTKYAILGASEIIHMKRAFYRGMHFHSMFPDVIYGRGYFERLQYLTREEKYDCILSHSINTRMEHFAPHYDPEMHPKRLAGLALEYLHPRLNHFVMNDHAGDLPLVPHMVFFGMDQVTVSGMHASLIFLHNKVLGFAPLHLNATLDSILPAYIPPGTKMKMPSAADQMVLAELSDKNWTNSFNRKGCALKEFSLRFWAVSEGNEGFFEILQMTTEFPIDTLPEKWRPFTDDEVEARLDHIHEYIRGIYPEVEKAFEMGGILEENGLNGPLYLPQDRMREHWNARAL